MFTSPGPSPSDIQSHLYSSFLQASTSDVSIRVKGTWTAVYRLHRVVLVQSGFFRSLFTSGFSESSPRRSRASDELEVVFDDYNITRPAFEICIARLYGGGPALYVSPNLLPTVSYPLTPPFSGVTESEEVPAGHHPATPHILLSLLATAIYLSIPSVASQALSWILKSIGPSTIIPYLRFALGRPIGIEVGDLKPATGLEHVAVLDAEEVPPPSQIRGTPSTGSLSSQGSNESFNTDDYDVVDDRPSYHYGGISHKIGESCASWLARWAVDMLRYEELDQQYEDVNRQVGKQRSMSFSSVLNPSAAASDLLSSPNAPIIPTIFGRGGLSAEWISTLVSSDHLFIRNEKERYFFSRTVVELRRRRGISEAEEKIWHTMFEQGIYYANMTFDEIFLVAQDVSPTTKKPFVSDSVLQAAHWTHSLLRHYVTSKSSNSSSIQSSPTTPPPQAKDRELAFTTTTNDLMSQVSEGPDRAAPLTSSSKRYFPVCGDASIRIGENPNATSFPASPPTMDQLFTQSHSLTSSTAAVQKARDKGPTPSTSHVPTGEAGYFGLLTERYDASACIKADPAGKNRWSSFPPLRFSVEFWDVEQLKEKSRLHSHTVWYAGSLFNAYVQVVRKKGQSQLGIYLHRQSHVDPIPTASTPFSNAAAATNQLAKVSSHNSLGDRSSPERPSSSHSSARGSASHTLHYSPSIHPLPRNILSVNPVQRPSSPPSPPSSPQFQPITPSSSFFNQPASPSSPYAPVQPYRDPRSSITAFFSITSASSTGSSQTRFSSSPDVFSVGQSWGWKSSTLKGEELVISDSVNPAAPSRGKEVSLRATIIVGLV